MAAPPPVHLVREAEGEPDGALVLLHGRGADEHDLVGVLDVLDPRRRLVGLTPGAPLTSGTRPASPASRSPRLPPDGRHWYLVPRVGFPDRDTFHASFEGLTAFLDGWLAERGLPWDRTVLGGFSMGAVMTYAVALGPGRSKPAGALAMSGFIPTVEGWSPDLEGRRGLPVAITHGRADPIMAVDVARSARERLEAAGLDVRLWETDVGHAIDPAIVGDLVAWVDARVPAGAAGAPG